MALFGLGRQNRQNLGRASCRMSERDGKQLSRQHCCTASQPSRTSVKQKKNTADQFFFFTTTKRYGDQAGSLKVWDLRTNTCTRALVPSGKVEIPLRSISISCNGKRVVAANNKVNVCSLFFPPFVSNSKENIEKGQCFVWRLSGDDTSVFEPYTKIDAHSTYITSVRISPDCKLVATSSSDCTVKVFDTKVGPKTKEIFFFFFLFFFFCFVLIWYFQDVSSCSNAERRTFRLDLGRSVVGRLVHAGDLFRRRNSKTVERGKWRSGARIHRTHQNGFCHGVAGKGNSSCSSTTMKKKKHLKTRKTRF
jgi:hypothetical protein